MSIHDLVALQGDESELYARHADALRRSVARLVNTPPEVVEDACAHAWLQLLRRQPRRETVWAWLVTVAKREAWRLHGIERHDLPLDDRARAESAAQAETVLAARLELAAAAAVLSDRQRRLVGLQAAGHTYAEIAAGTGCTVRTVDRQLRRAANRLRAVA